MFDNGVLLKVYLRSILADVSTQTLALIGLSFHAIYFLSFHFQPIYIYVCLSLFNTAVTEQLSLAKNNEQKFISYSFRD